MADLVSGSWPGEIYFFKGLGKGRGAFAAGTKLQGPDGKELKVGHASAVCLTDWNGDGRLDLLIGNIVGGLYLSLNEGTEKAFAFGAPALLSAGGTPFDRKTIPHGDAGPAVADWDGDGLADLIVGAGDGSVLFFRNTGEAGKPALAPPVTLVPKGKNMRTAPGEGAGTRAKVSVADWNGDGRPDLLVGDFASIPPVDTRTPEEKMEAEAAMAELRQRMAEVQRMAKPVPGESDEERNARMEKVKALAMELAPLQQKAQAGNGPSYSGHVWVYLREPK